jgi:hypothetical protein
VTLVLLFTHSKLIDNLRISYEFSLNTLRFRVTRVTVLSHKILVVILGVVWNRTAVPQFVALDPILLNEPAPVSNSLSRYFQSVTAYQFTSFKD